jgi:ubiquinone/menaquinone biosynthesis C-methylase UbiE
MDLKALQKNWDKFGKEDPFWAILLDPKKRGNKWNIDEFFNTGVQEIDAIMKYIESLGIKLPRRRALDFGCGVGRLTQALANYFDEVYGVDIAPSMIELAKKYNRYGDKCKYLLNESDDLKLFSDNFFDFIYTNITLQHMEPGYSKKYIREFVRTLSPGGLLIFQLPSEKRNKISRIVRSILPQSLLNFMFHIIFRARFKTSAVMEMYGIRIEDVVKFLNQLDVKIIDIQDQSDGGGWISFRYCVMKK